MRHKHYIHIIAIAFVTFLVSSCLKSESNFSPTLGLVSFSVNGDTLKFHSDNLGNVYLDTIFVGDTVSIVIWGDAHTNNIQKMSISHDDKKHSEIIMPPLDSLAIYPIPGKNEDVFQNTNDYAAGTLLFKESTVAYVLIKFKYVALQPSSDAFLGFMLISDADINPNSMYISFKTPIADR